MATPDFSKIVPIPEWDPYFKNLLKLLPKNPTILEVGTYLGATTVKIAEARPDARIITIDHCNTTGQWLPPYDDYVNEVLIGKHGVTPSKETMLENISRFPNIEFMEGVAPYDFENWNTEVDLFFDDGNHGQPWPSMSFFTKWVKPGGYFVAHDYGIPAVKKSVDSIYERSGWITKDIWAQQWGEPEPVSYSAVLKKSEMVANF